MSGSLTSIASAAGAVAGLLGLGGIGSGSPVTLGDIVLQGFEVPEAMPWGGQQQLIQHKLPGGARVVDSMGPDDRDIQFSGKFLGSDAVVRARQVDVLRLTGEPIQCTWGDFSRTVIVADFTPDYTTNGALIPFSLRLVVLTDVQAELDEDLSSLLVSDAMDAIEISGLAADAQAGLVIVQKALPLVAIFSKGSANFINAVSAVTQANNVMTGGIAAANGDISSLVSSLAVVGGGPSSAIAVMSASKYAQQLAAYGAASGFVSRMSSNMSSAGA